MNDYISAPVAPVLLFFLHRRGACNRMEGNGIGLSNHLKPVWFSSVVVRKA